MPLVWVGVALLLLTGCHSNPLDATVQTILSALTTATGLAAQRTKAGRDFQFYVRKRIQWLVGENSSWDAGPDYATLTTRIANEIDAIALFLATKLGTTSAPGPLGGAVDPNTPAHVDLADVAKVFVDDDPAIVAERTRAYTEQRRNRVREITWRAAALHHELWKDPDSSSAAVLDTPALTEILDRRLRFVERMKHTDYSQGADEDNRVGTWTITGRASGWREGLRTSLFEYPFIAIAPAHDDAFSAAVAAAGYSLDSTSPNFINSAFEVVPPPRHQIRLKSSGRMRPAAANHWEVSDYRFTMKLAGRTPAEILDLLIPSTSPVDPVFADRWERNWIYCDHMAAALEVDALRFGMRRRFNSDDQFNQSADDGVTLEVPVSSSGRPDPDDLMDEGDDHFEGVALAEEELEVGDLVIIWNNYFLRTVLETAFGLENSLISRMEGNDAKKSWLVGHGEPERTYVEFVESLLSGLGSLMERLREELNKALVVDPDGTYFDLRKSHFRFDLARWEPYGETFRPADTTQTLQEEGAWFIRVPLANTGSATESALSLNRALELFPKSVAVNIGTQRPPPLGPGQTHDADYRESIYIPLSFPRPKLDTRTDAEKEKDHDWRTYFAKVEADLADNLLPDAVVFLEDVVLDSGWAPGFHYEGPNSKIPVLRPKVRVS